MICICLCICIYIYIYTCIGFHYYYYYYYLSYRSSAAQGPPRQQGQPGPAATPLRGLCCSFVRSFVRSPPISRQLVAREVHWGDSGGLYKGGGPMDCKCGPMLYVVCHTTLLCYARLDHTILYYTTLHYTILWYSIIYYNVTWYDILFEAWEHAGKPPPAAGADAPGTEAIPD